MQAANVNWYQWPGPLPHEFGLFGTNVSLFFNDWPSDHKHLKLRVPCEEVICRPISGIASWKERISRAESNELGPMDFVPERPLVAVAPCSPRVVVRAGHVWALDLLAAVDVLLRDLLRGHVAVEVELSNPTVDTSFPREVRLLDAAGYGQVFKRNKRLSNRHWIVLAHRTKAVALQPTDLTSELPSRSSSEVQSKSGKTPAPGRLGLAIAKKRAKRAVDRNRIKRVARESFRHNRERLVGYDAVVMNKNHAASASAIELRQSLDTLWLELTNNK